MQNEIKAVTSFRSLANKMMALTGTKLSGRPIGAKPPARLWRLFTDYMDQLRDDMEFIPGIDDRQVFDNLADLVARPPTFSILAMQAVASEVLNLADVLCENRAMLWYNAMTVQIRTDVYQQSFATIMTKAAADNRAWDARNFVFKLPQDIMSSSFTVVNVDALRAWRMKKLIKVAKSRCWAQRLAMLSQIALAQGNNTGYSGMPSFGNSGAPLGGNVAFQIGSVRSTSLSAIPPVYRPCGTTIIFNNEGLASSYYDIHEIRFDVENHSVGYFANLTLNVSVEVSVIQARVDGFEPQLPPGTDPDIAVKNISVTRFAYTSPDGSPMDFNFAASLTRENAYQGQFCANIEGGTTPNGTLRIVIASDADPLSSSPIVRTTIRIEPSISNYILDARNVPVQNANEIKFVRDIRFDSVLGNGYRSVGDLGASLGGTVQFDDPGLFANAELFRAVNSHIQGAGVQDFISKYSAFNANINSIEKIVNTAYWCTLAFPSDQRVRQTLVNQRADSELVCAVVTGSNSVNNRVQTEVFGAPYGY